MQRQRGAGRQQDEQRVSSSRRRGETGSVVLGGMWLGIACFAAGVGVIIGAAAAYNHYHSQPTVVAQDRTTSCGADCGASAASTTFHFSTLTTSTPQYNGTYSGSTGINAAAVEISVSGNVITVSKPGPGSGSIEAGGATTFVADTGDARCTFTGSFHTTTRGENFANGQVKCALSGGGSLSGDWTAAPPR